MQNTYEKIRYKPSMSFWKYDGEILGGPFPALDNPEMPTPVHRAKLQRAVYEYTTSLGIQVTFGQHIRQYLDGPDQLRPAVITSTGKRWESDLIVAADGVGSKSWQLVQRTLSKTQSSGFAVYRTAFPTRIAHEDSLVAERFPVLDSGWDDVRMWLGPDTHAITVVSKELTTWLLTHKVSVPLISSTLLSYSKGYRNYDRIMVHANIGRRSA